VYRGSGAARPRAGPAVLPQQVPPDNAPAGDAARSAGRWSSPSGRRSVGVPVHVGDLGQPAILTFDQECLDPDGKHQAEPVHSCVDSRRQPGTRPRPSGPPSARGSAARGRRAARPRALKSSLHVAIAAVPGCVAKPAGGGCPVGDGGGITLCDAGQALPGRGARVQLSWKASWWASSPRLVTPSLVKIALRWSCTV